MGIILVVAVAPALVYTVNVAAKSKASGRPMAVFEKASTFIAAIVGVVVIAVSAFIAFFVTCIPVSIAVIAASYADIFVDGTAASIIVLLSSGTAAIAAAAFMTYLLLTRKRQSGGIPRKQ
jgi:hypothetical protein